MCLYSVQSYSFSGLCYSIRFNHSIIPSNTGPDNGLTLTLLTQVEEYLPRVSAAAGFKVELHDSRVLPNPQDRGFAISPGFETSVAVQKLYLKVGPLT